MLRLITEVRPQIARTALHLRSLESAMAHPGIDTDERRVREAAADRAARSAILRRDGARALGENLAFSEVSGERLCQSTGLSRATFYQYFEDKADLLSTGRCCPSWRQRSTRPTSTARYGRRWIAACGSGPMGSRSTSVRASRAGSRILPSTRTRPHGGSDG